MSVPAIQELESQELEEAGKIAAMIVGEEEYEHIRSSGGPFRREYDNLGDVELVELATDVVNGEYPELDERFSYGDEIWEVEDFVEHAVDASETPFSNKQHLSEMKGTTQLDAEIYDLKDIAENRQDFPEMYIEDTPPEKVDLEEDGEKNWLRIVYTGEENTVTFSDYVKLMPMEDKKEPTPDADIQERVYWPE